MKQIHDVAMQMKENSFTSHCGIQLLVHSPLIRARETAYGLFDIINNDPSRATMNDTDDNGTSVPPRVVVLNEIREKYASGWLPGNISKLYNRIDQFEQWLHEQPETVIAVVGHSQFFKAMLQLDFKFHNCDVWKTQFNNAHATATKMTTPMNTGSYDNRRLSARHNPKSTIIQGNSYCLPPQWKGLQQIYQCRFHASMKTNEDDDDDYDESRHHRLVIGVPNHMMMIP
jgi:broad specificity phosphatase PhoE